MMAGNPNWWSIYSPSLISPQSVLGSSSVSSSSLTDNQNTPHSWSQMLMTGLPNEEERMVPSYFPTKKFENWEDQILNPAATRFPVLDVIKQEVSHSNNSLYVLGHEEFQASEPVLWSQTQIMPVSSPTSCVTSLSNSIFDFTENKACKRSQLTYHTSECNSTATASFCKKPRVQNSSQPPLKVRKEKLGDRITALHQLVSPFGKTDTASVLMEAIGYIRFLLGQIEALTSPYVVNTSKNIRSQQYIHGERNCIFPEDPGQLLNDTCLERKGAPNRDTQGKTKNLRSRGLSLVPVSCTQNVVGVNGADYWAPPYGGGF